MLTGYWNLHVPPQAIGLGTQYFDLWNGSSRPITLSSLIAIKDGSVALTGTLSARLLLKRTGAVGTGGTAAVEDDATSTVCSFSKLQEIALPDGITARLTPTGGLSATAMVTERHLFPEETNAANYEPLEFLPAGLLIPNGTGILVGAGAAGSAAGSVAFQATFY